MKGWRKICIIIMAAVCGFTEPAAAYAAKTDMLEPFEELVSQEPVNHMKMKKAGQKESEPNDEIANANEITVGKAVEGTTGIGDGADIYKFTLKKTSYINISLTHEATNMTGNMWFAYLRDVKGNLVNETTDNVFSMAERTYAESKVTKLKKGVYYLTVVGHTLALGQRYQASVNRITAEKPAILTADSADYRSVMLTWQAVPGTVRYKIYRSSQKTGGYQQVATVKGAETTSWTDSGLATGKKYYYKMKAVVAADRNYTSGYSKAVSVKPAPAAASLITFVSNKNITLRWSKVSGASGYEIVRSTKPTGSYRKIKTIKKGKATSYTDGKGKSGETYYYKIRAYRVVNGKKNYGAYSNMAFGIVS